jgi:hypothetical protein
VIGVLFWRRSRQFADTRAGLTAEAAQPTVDTGQFTGDAA